eukprot:1854738-Rhodomonas_salina.1
MSGSHLGCALLHYAAYGTDLGYAGTRCPVLTSGICYQAEERERREREREEAEKAQEGGEKTLVAAYALPMRCP